MAVNKRKINFTTVGFTPTGGSLQSITAVQSIQHDEQASTIASKGDNEIRPTHRAVINADHNVTITHQDHTAHQAVTLGAAGALTYKIKDGNGDNTGDVTATLSNAVCVNKSRSHQHAAYASLTLGFESYSSDGSTSPMAYT
jgi:hypothetical protein